MLLNVSIPDAVIYIITAFVTMYYSLRQLYANPDVQPRPIPQPNRRQVQNQLENCAPPIPRRSQRLRRQPVKYIP